jgi:hypothetical protein
MKNYFKNDREPMCSGEVSAVPGTRPAESLKPGSETGRFVKPKKFFSILILLCAVILLPSCKIIEANMHKRLTSVLKNTRVFIVDPDHPVNRIIKLRTKEVKKEIENRDITISFEKGLLKGTLSPGDDDNSTHLTVAFADGVKPAFHIDIMHLSFKNAPHITATAYVVARPSSLLVAETIPSYLNNIGQGMNVTSDFLSHTGLAALDSTALYSDDMVNVMTNAETTGIEINASKYTDVISQMSEQLGISASGIPGKGKAKGFLFGCAFNQTFNKDTETTSKLEFTVEILQKRMVTANLGSDFTLDNPEVVLKYIGDEANRALNVPADNLYQAFTDDKAGIFKLYDTYGTHVMTSGVFGGTYIYAYARKQTSYFYATSFYAGASLSERQAAHGANGNWMDSYLANMHAQNASISASGSDYNSDYSETYGEMTAFIVAGGAASPDFGVWDASIVDADSNLAMIQYSTDSNDNASGLIPLYYLATGTRRALMEQYLEDYLTSKEIPINDTPKLVVADFQMRDATNGHDSSVKPVPQTLLDASGTERLYFPLMANKYARADQGKMLDTSQSDYIEVADATDQLWWYALAFSDELAKGSGGIKDIRFYDADEANSKNYTCRGDRADTSMNYSDIDNHYVSLSWTNAPDEMITGVGLLMNNDGNGYEVIASSAGTEMLLPFENSSNLTQFTSHWGTFPVAESDIETSTYWTLGSDDGSAKSCSWWGKNGAAHSSDYKFFPVYVKSRLSDNFTTQKPNAW